MTEKTQQDKETDAEIAHLKPVEDYIASLQWSPDTSDEVKTYVIGNLRGFYSWLQRQPCGNPVPCSAQAGGDPQKGCDWPLCGCDTNFNAALETLSEGGFCIVPVTPTKEMVRAGAEALAGRPLDDYPQAAEGVWEDMIERSQRPSDDWKAAVMAETNGPASDANRP